MRHLFRRLFDRPLIRAILAGGIASLALPPIHALPLICALSVAASSLLKATRKREAFWLGWGTGFGWFFVSFYWLANALVTGGPAFYWMIPFAVLALPMGLALFWGLAFLLVWRCFSRAPARLAGLCFWLMVMEWLRGTILTGFPWQLPGMLFGFAPLGFDLASILGVYGCGVVALWLAILPIAWRCHRGFASMLAVLIALGFGLAYSVSYRPIETSTASGLAVRLVQPSIPQHEKWARNHRPNHLQQYLDLSLNDRLGDTNAPIPELIIWGETSYAGRAQADLPQLKTYLTTISRHQSALIIGSIRRNQSGQYFNSAFLLDANANIVEHYDKRFLVPFGEFAPFRKIMPAIAALVSTTDFSPGDTPTQLPLTRNNGQIVHIAPLICYEIIYPTNTRKISKNADVIVNITNDAWFGNSLGPRQHLAMTQMRAAELGLPIVRVAGTGISAAINPYGKIITRINYREIGAGDAVLSGRTTTFYARWGEVGFIFVLLISLGLGFVFRWRFGDER